MAETSIIFSGRAESRAVGCTVKRILRRRAAKRQARNLRAAIRRLHICWKYLDITDAWKAMLLPCAWYGTGKILMACVKTIPDDAEPTYR
jgi:hypothetical protein